MTLNEIKKVIDECDIYLELDDRMTQCDVRSSYGLNDKEYFLERVSHAVKFGGKVILLKINKKGKIVKYVYIDRIDPEKKVIKKKLGDMSDEEIDNLFKKNCKYNSCGCENCPLILQIKDGFISCIYGFKEAKRTYDFFKDKEFEIEVEE